MKKRMAKIMSAVLVSAMAVSMMAGCGSDKKETTGSGSSTQSTGAVDTSDVMSNEEIIKKAAGEGKVSNWGIGNQYEIQALLAKYGLPTEYLSEDFTMDAFDDDSSTLASAMTYNELGLVKNDYDGAYGYGDTVGYIDMNDEGVAMLEDMIFCLGILQRRIRRTVKAFLYASIKGWEYAVENPEEAAQIVYDAGSSVSQDHQKYMASEVAKLVKADMNGNEVSDIGKIDDDAMQQTLDIAKKYVTLDDSSAQDKFAKLTLDDIRDTSYYEAAESSDGKFSPKIRSIYSVEVVTTGTVHGLLCRRCQGLLR